MELPDQVRIAWDDRVPPCVLSTVDAGGTPNTIWVNCLRLLDDGRSSGHVQVAIADNYFCKTLANLLGGSRGALLFRDGGNVPYQFKGRFEYHTTGPVFEGMSAWNQPGRPGKGTAVLHVEEVYSRAEKLCGG